MQNSFLKVERWIVALSATVVLDGQCGGMFGRKSTEVSEPDPARLEAPLLSHKPQHLWYEI